MAKSNPLPLFLLLLLVFLCSSNTVARITENEVDSAIAALRSSGYALFGNGIAVSDLLFDLLHHGPNASFTLFAPTDAALFALGIAYPAAAYLRVLRQHVAVRHLTRRSLRSIPSGTPVPTLLLSRHLIISHRRDPVGGEGLDVATVDGVDVVLPGIFHCKDLAVHGLNGILAPRKSESSDGIPYEQPVWPDKHLPPDGFDHTPDSWTPAGSPAPDLSPISPDAVSPVPMPAYPYPITLPPSFLDESYSPRSKSGWKGRHRGTGKVGASPTSSPAAGPPPLSPPQQGMGDAP
ncbi:hypothetical protein OPV22_008394 [Ensete ventricosum]|uniref:FAS1 domain-containing protein n=1 Tax=Ensete ventricosum TaxID=4639 RepID=A0AAV8RAZ7_ENSVE|nr:hypothetical protein OPV22_008394 [Ensete ventricosum]